MSKLIDETSIPVLLQEMSPREKVDLLTGSSAFSSTAMPQYGIPAIRYLDGATGVNLMQYLLELADVKMAQKDADEAADSDRSSNESGSSLAGFIAMVMGKTPTPDNAPEGLRVMVLALKKKLEGVRPDDEEPGCFPPGMLLAATWQPELIYKVGEAVAREAMAYGIDVLLGTPNTNIHRDPCNGRLFESFSEDPYLCSQMAPAFVRGVQDQGMVANVKHFAANNQETLRQGIDERITERALREIYLPGFAATVIDGSVATVMSAYNSINGVPCAQNHWLLTDVLKNEWGFQGQVVSDWGAVYDQVAALNAGNDMDMPGPRGKKKLYQAVDEGIISQERLDDAVTRLLRIILKTPAFNGRKYTVIDNELSRQAAYNAAVEGITLLKNDGLLPLKKGTKVALFGRLARRFMESGSGSAQVDTNKFTSLPTEVARHTDSILVDEIGEETDVVLITAGASGQEGRDRPGMILDPEEEVILRDTIGKAKTAGKKIGLLLNIAGPVELGEYINEIDALVCLFFPGMEGARAAADILFGTVSPSGKLPLTFPRTYRDCPTSINFPGEFGQVVYGEGIFVGYRYYDHKNIEPLYPFGFGLSYSCFSITDIQVSEPSYANTSKVPLIVRATVKNEGNMIAQEVVQLYVRAAQSTLQKPEKELKGFTKVSLLPGEQKKVEIRLTPLSFASYDTALGQWTIEPGEYQLLVGNSSRNITCKSSIHLTGKNPYGYSIKSPIGKIAGNADACRICYDVLGKRFKVAHLKSQAAYFSSTSLTAYLEYNVKPSDSNTAEWQAVLSILNDQLGELDTIDKARQLA